MTYETLEQVNARIREMTRYGVNEIITSSRCYCIIWSNASKCWYVTYYAYSKGQKISVDANQLLVKQTKKQIQTWIDTKALNDLPLYSNSFEGRRERLKK